MAFLVRRKDGRGEIRESVATTSGPRARTLATFRVLTEDVLDEAAARAHGTFDRAELRARALDCGLPQASQRAARTARRLISELRRGDRPPAVLIDVLERELPPVSPIPDTIDSAIAWIGATDAQRGATLRDLVELGDALPKRRRGDRLPFPRLESRRGRAVRRV
jgi:hypothetical protein